MEAVFWIIVIFVVVASWKLIFNSTCTPSSPPNYIFPPGPRGIPLIGCPWIIFGELHKTFTKLKETWGEIFTVNLFGVKFVVLNSKDIIRNAHNSSSFGEIFAGRPPTPPSVPREIDRATAFLQPSPLWTKQRKLIHKVLSMYGDGIQAMEDKVQGELKHACEWLNRNNDQPIDLDSVLYPSLINILLILLTGERKEYGSKVLKNVRVLDETVADLGSVGNGVILSLFPFARYLPFGPGSLVKINETATNHFLQDVYEETKTTFDPKVTRGMVDYMLHQQNVMRQEDGSTWLSDTQIKATALEVVGAGSLTTRSSLSAFFLIVSQHPEVAKRIQSEIEIFCPGRLPSLQDRSNMPYTMAAILELLRYISHVPLSLLHMTTEDVTFKGYRIPAKTRIVTNLWNVHHFDETWTDPWKFRPERYLGEDGSLLPADHNLRKSTMPFGIGRRSCAGESFAKSRLFLFVTTLLQKFNFTPDFSRPLPSCDPSGFKKGIVTSPPQYFLKITSRY